MINIEDSKLQKCERISIFMISQNLDNVVLNSSIQWPSSDLNTWLTQPTNLCLSTFGGSLFKVKLDHFKSAIVSGSSKFKQPVQPLQKYLHVLDIMLVLAASLMVKREKNIHKNIIWEFAYVITHGPIFFTQHISFSFVFVTAGQKKAPTSLWENNPEQGN